MPLPQDIRPVFQDIQDTLVRSDSPDRAIADREDEGAVGRPGDRTSRCSSTGKRPCRLAAKASRRGACLFISGKLSADARSTPAITSTSLGILHDATTALEDTTYLFICNGGGLVFRREQLHPGISIGKSSNSPRQAAAPQRRPPSSGPAASSRQRGLSRQSRAFRQVSADRSCLCRARVDLDRAGRAVSTSRLCQRQAEPTPSCFRSGCLDLPNAPVLSGSGPPPCVPVSSTRR